MKVNLTEQQIKATRTALYHQWHKITDINGKAIDCTQETADATFEALQVLEKVEKRIKQLKSMEVECEYVESNIGLIPLEDYYDIVASQNGFEDYDHMQSEGYCIDRPITITKEEFEKELELE